MKQRHQLLAIAILPILGLVWLLNTPAHEVEAASVNLISSATHVGDSGDFDPEYPVEALWDGCLTGFEFCSTGQAGIGSFTVDFDLGSVTELTEARLFGDATNRWLSSTWGLDYRSNQSDMWQTVFSGRNALVDNWVRANFSISARYVRLIVTGPQISGNVHAREFELYGVGPDLPSPDGEIDFSANQMNLPSCNSANAITINSPSQLSRFENRGNSRLICFDGDFRNTTLTVDGGGTASNPLILRFNGSRFQNLLFDGSSVNNIIVDGIHVNKQGLESSETSVGRNMSNITINNSIFENGNDVLIKVLGPNVTVQNSILRYSLPEPNKDRHCLSAFPYADNLKVLNNVIKDCAGDGIQILPGVWEDIARDHPANVQIVNNRIFIEDLILPGNMACAENAIDLKAGDNMLVKDNIMHGFRQTDASCSGSGSWGTAMAIHRMIDRVTLDSNIMYDSADMPGSSNSCINIRSSGARHFSHRITYVGDNICHMYNDSGDNSGSDVNALVYLPLSEVLQIVSGR